MQEKREDSRVKGKVEFNKEEQKRGERRKEERRVGDKRKEERRMTEGRRRAE